MFTIANLLPQPDAEFPSLWIDEFKQELIRSALRRARIVTNTLLVIESVLLISDFYRTHWPAGKLDGILVWRLVTLTFLLTYSLGVVRLAPTLLRLRYFLIFGMFLCCWISALLAGVAGDVSTFSIGALGVAAACPLPGRFNSNLFIIFGAALIGYLYAQFPNAELYWLSNIVATCVIGVVIEKFTFAAALREFSQRKGIVRQRERADELLYNVFPQSVATSLKDGKRSIALHGEVTILFADVVGFTELSSHLLPSQLLDLLENIFDSFDQLAVQHGVEKVKTIGDAYMAICGAPLAIDHQVERMADFALAMVQSCQQLSARSGFALALRVGIHTGPVVAGVIGRSRLCYDLWGDSVNLAQRLEVHSEPATIAVSEPVYYKLRDLFELSDRGVIDLKGKGPTRTYALGARRASAADSAYARNVT